MREWVVYQCRASLCLISQARYREGPRHLLSYAVGLSFLVGFTGTTDVESSICLQDVIGCATQILS